MIERQDYTFKNLIQNCKNFAQIKLLVYMETKVREGKYYDLWDALLQMVNDESVYMVADQINGESEPSDKEDLQKLREQENTIVEVMNIQVIEF